MQARPGQTLMGCNCGGAREGFVVVWQYRARGQLTREFETQAEAEQARKGGGGFGTVLRVTRKA